jgi:nitrate reductase delta subunit
VTGPREAAVICQAASILLQYPDDHVLDRVPLVTAAVATLPAGVPRVSLEAFLGHLAGTPPRDLGESYVATFDRRRRCCLYLTWWTRRRGQALAALKERYRRGGLELGAGELPDFLPVVLEYAATGDLADGLALLQHHRAGLELLRLALVDASSPRRRGGGRLRAAARPLAAGPGGGPPVGPDRPAGRERRPETVPRTGRGTSRTRRSRKDRNGRSAPMSTLDILQWAVLPYVTIAILVAGSVWRHRYDQFGWTTRSSELYESRLLRIGSPLFHFGILVVVVGHIIGLVSRRAGRRRPGCPRPHITSRRSPSAPSRDSRPWSAW